jgi:aryl-alcohol dehydrogenase-like predicted oxidoreductase
MAIEYRRLGASGLEVSRICLGTMMFGDRTDAGTSRRIIDAAFDAGINFIDTADVYNKGTSESIVGAAIAAHRRNWILATKVGNVMTSQPHDGGLSRRWILQACEESLRRLATDYIDIYYLHKDDPETPIAETVGAIGDLLRSGKIRYFGVSNYRGWRIAEVVNECEAQGVPLPVVCQPYYNLLNRGPEVEILPACDHYGIGVAPYSPVARGLLTGKYAPGVVPEDSRGGRKNRLRSRKSSRSTRRRPAARPRSSHSRGCGRTRSSARSSRVRARSSSGRITWVRWEPRGATRTRRSSIPSSHRGIRRHPDTTIPSTRSTAEYSRTDCSSNALPRGYRDRQPVLGG